MSLNSPVFSPFKHTPLFRNLTSDQSVFKSPTKLSHNNRWKIFTREQTLTFEHHFSFVVTHFTSVAKKKLCTWVFLFACSCSKVCLTDLVMNFQALNDLVPWDYRLWERLSTWRTVGWSKFNKSDLPNTMAQEPKSSWATRTQPSKTQCHGEGPDVTLVCVCAALVRMSASMRL